MKLSNFINLVNQQLETNMSQSSLELVKFCATETNCNYCAKLVYQRVKTATCSLTYWYDELNEKEPQCGDLWLIQDWYENPVALVKVISSKRSKFCDVGADFAHCEGEGDRSLKYWQNEHRQFFGHELNERGLVFSESIELSLQRFEVLLLNPEWK